MSKHNLQSYVDVINNSRLQLNAAFTAFAKLYSRKILMHAFFRARGQIGLNTKYLHGAIWNKFWYIFSFSNSLPFCVNFVANKPNFNQILVKIGEINFKFVHNSELLKYSCDHISKCSAD